MILLFLALVSGKLVDLVQDPFMTSLTHWKADPTTSLCRNCTDLPTVGPSVANGLYSYCYDPPLSSVFCSLSQEIKLANVDSVNLTVAVQVGGGGLFTMDASYQDFRWSWSALDLGQIAVGVYRNVSVLMTFGSPVYDTLKLGFHSTPGNGDFISVNEVHLFAEVSEPLSALAIAAIVVGLLLLLMLAGWVIHCYRVNQQYNRNHFVLLQ